MITHQKIRGLLKRHGFKIGRWSKGIISDRFTRNAFEVKKGSIFNDSVYVQYYSGGCNGDFEKGVVLTREVANMLENEGYIVKYRRNGITNKLSENNIEVFDR